MKTTEKAYWISPYGRIKGFSVGCHIKEVCNNPQGFGVSEKWLKKVFNKHNEKWATEGRAREEVIIRLVKRGWMRLRKYNRPDRWALNVGSLNAINADFIRDFATRLITKGTSPFEEIWIDTAAEGQVKVSVKDISEGELAKKFGFPIRWLKFHLKFVDEFNCKDDYLRYNTDFARPESEKSTELTKPEKPIDLISILKRANGPTPACYTNGKDYQKICESSEYREALVALKAEIHKIPELKSKDYIYWEGYHRTLIEKWEKYTPGGWYGIRSIYIPREWYQAIDKTLDFIVRFDPDFEIHQIKIKFGRLCFYVPTGLKLDGLISLLGEKLSSKLLIY